MVLANQNGQILGNQLWEITFLRNHWVDDSALNVYVIYIKRNLREKKIINKIMHENTYCKLLHGWMITELKAICQKGGVMFKKNH